jgi:hypothetical protein
MLRVMETMTNSIYADDLVAQTNNMTSWINEILTGVWVNQVGLCVSRLLPPIVTSTSHQQANGTLLNVLDDPTSFADSSSTALLSSVTYRMAAITSDTTHVVSANNALLLVSQSLDANGWLQNTVNPYSFWTPTTAGGYSAEGQAFVLLMHAAWRDYVAVGGS